MLRIAIPNKGSLSEGAQGLILDAGYSSRRIGRELVAIDYEHDVEILFLRPRDIAIYVGNGILDFGITGRDLALDSGADFIEVLGLGFGQAAFRYAVPRGSRAAIVELNDLRIATSYPRLVQNDLQTRGMTATVVHLDGAVEISIRLGVADAIADVVQSGKTLEEAGLEAIGEPILRSEAILIARRDADLNAEPARVLIERLQGILTARTYAMVEYDLPSSLLESAVSITPGIEAPTISPLKKEGWVAVKAMAPRKGINGVMDALKKLGAKGIIVTDIRCCRL